MASTYTPQNAVDLVKEFTHGAAISDDSAARACDMVNSIMWTFYPWTWSINALTAITLTDGVQDYTPTDTDILRPVKIMLARTDTTPNEVRELDILANLGVELTRKGGIDTNTAAGFLPTGKIRLMYAASVGTGQTLQLQGFYQKVPTSITKDTMQTAFVFPDHYFNVFVEGLKWQLYTFADDQRGGIAQYSKNGSMMRQYSGYYGVFMDSLLTMARTEDLRAGDEFSFPESGLGVGRSYWPGLFGL